VGNPNDGTLARERRKARGTGAPMRPLSSTRVPDTNGRTQRRAVEVADDGSFGRPVAVRDFNLSGGSKYSWLGLVSVSVAASCVPAAVVPPPVPPPAPVPSAPAPPQGVTERWSFESGLQGWHQDGGRPQPVCDPVSAARLPSSMRPTLGGDYWMTGIDVGQDGQCRIDTGAASARTPARLLSPPFRIAQPYLVLRVGGGGRPGTRIALRLEGQPGWAREEHGGGQLAMGGVIWDVRDAVGKVAQVVVEDEAGDGILVDDIFDASAPPPPRPPPVWGFADTHSHPVAQLGFGRNVFFGDTDGAIGTALQSCEAAHGKNGDGGKAGVLMGFTEPSFNRVFGHRPTGAPDFDGWPRWSTLVHQQMYVDWIRRAWQGGLRLLVAHAVNNEQLAANFHGVAPFDDMSVVQAQLTEIKGLAERHADFMEIAKTPADARRIIAAGRLAVVPGVEVDAIGGCRREKDCTTAEAVGAIGKLYDGGARHVFPIHLADNAFGGSAVWGDGIYDLLTWYLTNDYQGVAHDDSVAFTLSLADQALPVWFAHLARLKNMYGNAPYSPPLATYRSVPVGHVNQQGLTPVGNAVLRELRRRGMIVDIDHMGERARADSLDLFSQLGTPVAMGHAWFRDLGYDKGESQDSLKLRNDIMKTAAEIERVRGLGGIVSPIANQRDVRRVDGAGTGNDCEGASTSFLEAYVYAVQRMGDAGVGFGTDFNGLPGQPLPRFGPYACTGREKTGGGADEPRRAPGLTALQTVRADADAQDAGVTYDQPLQYSRTNRFYGPRNGADAPYTNEERAIWIAVASCKANRFEGPDGDLTASRDLVVPVASGLCGRPQQGARSWWQAATLVHEGGPRPASGDARRRYDLIAGIVGKWGQMESGNQDHPLVRSFIAEGHDADVNLDGLSEYGLLPDFLQDVANQLKARKADVHDLSAMFRSAETYLRTWERVEASASP
jgi:microsomal dipeptidase-like Zn-dependent dipeptidase